MSDIKWVDSKGLKYPWCFDLSHEKAKIGGAESYDIGSNLLIVEFSKCDKDEPGYED